MRKIGRVVFTGLTKTESPPLVLGQDIETGPQPENGIAIKSKRRLHSGQALGEMELLSGPAPKKPLLKRSVVAGDASSLVWPILGAIRAGKNHCLRKTTQ